MNTIEWEIIDIESVLKEFDLGEIVSVSREKDYIGRMSAQNTKVIECLRHKYPDRRFRLSKWHNHDFGQYQEVEEAIEYKQECADCLEENCMCDIPF